MKTYLDPILAHGIGSGNPLADQSSPLQEVSDCLRRGEEVVIVVGKSGTGKSTLLRSLRIPPDWSATRLLTPQGFGECTDTARFLNSIAYQFGLRRGDTLSKLGMSLPGEPMQVAQGSVLHRWSEHEVSELVGELVATEKPPSTSLLRVDHCERTAFASDDDLIALRGACLAAGPNFRVILVVRQDALGLLLDALDGCFKRQPHLVFVYGLEPSAAVAYATAVLDRAGVIISPSEVQHLISALERGGYVWPVALNAVLEEIILTPLDRELLKSTRFSPRDINQLLGASVERRLTSAPAGLSDECYWTLRAIDRNEQVRQATTEHSLISASTTRNPAELQAVLDHLAAVRLVVRDATGGWHLTHEAISGVLQHLWKANPQSDDADILDVIELWRHGGRLSVSDAAKLLNALQVAPTLPLAALVLLSMAMATGLVGDLPGAAERLRRKLQDSSCEDIQVSIRSLRAALKGREAIMLDAALLYSGTTEGIRAFLDFLSSASLSEREWTIPATVERLLMGVEAAPLEDAIDCNTGLLDKPLMASAVMRCVLRRNDVNISLNVIAGIVDAVRELDPGLALESVARFDPSALAVHCMRCLKSTRPLDKLAALAKLIDAPERVVHECASAISSLSASSETLVRRQVLSLLAARPDVFKQPLRQSFFAEISPLVRESVLEVIRPEHPDVAEIVTFACRDSNDFVRESAVYAAGRCALPLVTLQPLLLEAVKDNSEKVREAGIRICQKLGISLPLSEILMGLRSHNEALLSAFVSALGAESTDDIDLALADIAVDAALRKDIRTAALARLGERGGEISVWTVATLLNDTDPEVLALAIASAQMVADTRHLVPLRQLSRHPIGAVRERVVYAMAEIGGEVAVDTCLELLFDPVADIRARAVYALLRLGASTHWQIIERTLMHEENVVVLEAIAEARKAFKNR